MSDINTRYKIINEHVDHIPNFVNDIYDHIERSEHEWKYICFGMADTINELKQQLADYKKVVEAAKSYINFLDGAKPKDLFELKEATAKYKYLNALSKLKEME